MRLVCIQNCDKKMLWTSSIGQTFDGSFLNHFCMHSHRPNVRLIFSFMGEVLCSMSYRGDCGDEIGEGFFPAPASREDSPKSELVSVSLSPFDGRLSTAYDTSFSRKNASAFVW